MASLHLISFSKEAAKTGTLMTGQAGTAFQIYQGSRATMARSATFRAAGPSSAFG
jgi:hypothetical protein